MKILFIGDIFGETGIRAVQSILPNLKKELHLDYVIANGENTTNCKGLSNKDYERLVQCGIDFFTMGNHTWGCEETPQLLQTKNNIVRPFNINSNFKYSHIGVGTRVVVVNNCSIRITNLLGESIKMNNLQSNPFFAMDDILNNYDKTDFHIVDYHTEMTSEKNAFFNEFKGKVSVILGTHTHVQTNDSRIRDNTAFITDAGMTGPSEGVIGAKVKNMIPKFRNLANSFVLEEESGPYQFSAVCFEFDETNKKVLDIKKILIYEKDSN